MSLFKLAGESINMAKLLKEVVGSLLLHFALTKGEVVELDRGPIPDKHLQSIGSSLFKVLV
jgi:hypothetical protein